MCRLSLFVAISMFTAIAGIHVQVVFPLKIKDDKHDLVDENNKPFSILGRTAWFIISQTDGGYKKFPDNTIEHGHNTIEMAVITQWPMGNHAPFKGKGNMPFLKRLNENDWDGNLMYNNLKMEVPDLLTPNEKYWAFADDFLSYCKSRGLLVFMFPGYIGYNGEEQGWMKEPAANGTIKTEAYGAWIANRYKDRKNIVWMLLGDMGESNEDQRNAEAALIKGLKSVKGQRSVQYSAESYSGQNAADNADFGEEMTLNGSYTWELKVQVTYITRKAYAYEPAIPSFLLEGPYDEEGPDENNYNPSATQPVRRFQWWGMAEHYWWLCFRKRLCVAIC